MRLVPHAETGAGSEVQVEHDVCSAQFESAVAGVTSFINDLCTDLTTDRHALGDHRFSAKEATDAKAGVRSTDDAGSGTSVGANTVGQIAQLHARTGTNAEHGVVTVLLFVINQYRIAERQQLLTGLEANHVRRCSD